VTNTTAKNVSVYAERPTQIVKRVLDTGAVNMAINDVAVLFCIPPRHRLANLRLEVTKVEGAAATVDVGPFSDAGTTAVDADGLIDGADVNALTHAHSVTGAGLLAAKGVCTGATAQYICLTAMAALDAAIIEAQAELIPYNL